MGVRLGEHARLWACASGLRGVRPGVGGARAALGLRFWPAGSACGVRPGEHARPCACASVPMALWPAGPSAANGVAVPLH